MQQTNLQSLNVHQIMERMRSKKELYTFLTQEGHAYLPKLESTNVYFLKQVLQGSKNYIERENVHVAQVPQIEGLTVHDILEFAKERPSLLSYLPDQTDWLHCDRKWICDIIYSLEQEQFQIFINQALKIRKEKLEKNLNLLVNIKPQFAQALQNTLQFSTHKGRSVFLLKDTSHRKRRRLDIEEVKDEEIKFKKDKQEYLKEIKRIKESIQQKENTINQLRGFETLVHQLHESGVIDQEGNPQAIFSNDSIQNQQFRI